MSVETNGYTCYSGGAIGSDWVFETESEKHGFNVVSFSFNEHNTKSQHRLNLSEEQLKEGFEHIKIANRRLKRNLSYISPYVKNLISRDWFQVKHADAIFAIGRIYDNNVMGGTGYAVACAIDNKKPVYVFDQIIKCWNYYDYNNNKLKEYYGVPDLTKKFAGIGTRDINNDGINAILNLFNLLRYE